jgi:pantoate--beta-alanine ligase
METISSISEFRAARLKRCQAASQAKKTRPKVGFVPTMGNLHEGHCSLMRRMRDECGVRIASIFVNSTQFGPTEDFKKYPRTLEADLEKCAQAGVDIVFAPEEGEIYSANRCTQVSVSGITDRYCGLMRPGHFDGVSLVVAKLFNIVQPDIAYFGQKDYQQLQVIEKMTEDLNFQLQVALCPTVREESGLAMSSRNSYLTAEQRAQASSIYAGLKAAGEAFNAGERKAETLKAWVRSQLDGQVRLEYLEIADGTTLEICETADDGNVVLIAARLGTTRLIDNIILRARE